MAIESKPPMWAPKCDVCRQPAVGQVHMETVFLFLCAQCWPTNQCCDDAVLWKFNEFMSESDV